MPIPEATRSPSSGLTNNEGDKLEGAEGPGGPGGPALPDSPAN